MKNNLSKIANMTKKKWIILDWAGNDCFNGRLFKTIDGAQDYLTDRVHELYPETVENEDAFYEQMNEYQFMTEEEFKGFK